MEILALIPARGGSKGIKRKNLVPVRGKPLIAHSIEHARASGRITRVLVSTEDPEIRDVALACGAEVPFLRPRELAEDHVLDLPVFEHVLRTLDERETYRPEIVVHLRPTAPYRKAGWIDAAVDELIGAPDADSVRSVSLVVQHPYRMFELAPDGYLTPFLTDVRPRPYELRRQDLPPVYYYNCVIDVTRPRTILEKHSMTGDRMRSFVMSADEVVDVDTPRDLDVAEVVLGRLT